MVKTFIGTNDYPTTWDVVMKSNNGIKVEFKAILPYDYFPVDGELVLNSLMQYNNGEPRLYTITDENLKKEAENKMTKREVVIKFCRNKESRDIDYLQECQHNLYCLTNNKLNDFEGCPQNFGLNESEELCDKHETYKDMDWQGDEMCHKCWENALREE